MEPTQAEDVQVDELEEGILGLEGSETETQTDPAPDPGEPEAPPETPLVDADAIEKQASEVVAKYLNEVGCRIEVVLQDLQFVGNGRHRAVIDSAVVIRHKSRPQR